MKTILLDRSTSSQCLKIICRVWVAFRRYVLVCVQETNANDAKPNIALTARRTIERKRERESEERKAHKHTNTQCRRSIAMCGACSSSLLLFIYDFARLSSFSFQVFPFLWLSLADHDLELAVCFAHRIVRFVARIEWESWSGRAARLLRERERELEWESGHSTLFFRVSNCFSNKFFSSVRIFRSVRSHSGTSWARALLYLLQWDHFVFFFLHKKM